MEMAMPRDTGAVSLWLHQWKPRIRCRPDRLGGVAVEPITLGWFETGGPRVGLVGLFLIHIKEVRCLEPFLRQAVVGDEGDGVDRRRRD
jgi:hypothetical protein